MEKRIGNAVGEEIGGTKKGQKMQDFCLQTA